MTLCGTQCVGFARNCDWRTKQTRDIFISALKVWWTLQSYNTSSVRQYYAGSPAALSASISYCLTNATMALWQGVASDFIEILAALSANVNIVLALSEHCQYVSVVGNIASSTINEYLGYPSCPAWPACLRVPWLPCLLWLLCLPCLLCSTIGMWHALQHHQGMSILYCLPHTTTSMT